VLRTSKAQALVVLKNEPLTSRQVEFNENYQVVFEHDHVIADGAGHQGLPHDSARAVWHHLSGELRPRCADGGSTHKKAATNAARVGHMTAVTMAASSSRPS
jgi:hypothetical protein